MPIYSPIQLKKIQFSAKIERLLKNYDKEN
jgi:hypothetical protein